MKKNSLLKEKWVSGRKTEKKLILPGHKIEEEKMDLEDLINAFKKI